MNATASEQRLYWLLAFLSLALLFFSRAPFFLQGFELNKDESQMMALSMRITDDWIPWSSASTETNGPFIPWTLAALRFVGFEISYSLVHLCAVVIQSCTLILGWRIAVRLSSPFPALIALMATCIGLSISLPPDFIHFSTELFPLLFLALGLYFIVGTLGEITANPWRLLTGAFFIGLSPWAKLQVGPIALAICGWIAFSLLAGASNKAGGLKRAWLLLACVVIVAWTPTLIMITLCTIGGSLGLMWDCYFVFNMSYAGSKTGAELQQSIISSANLPWTQIALLSILSASLMAGSRLFASRRRSQTLLVLALLTSSAYSVLRPKYEFLHYNILLLLPAQIAIALMLHECLETLHEENGYATALNRRIKCTLIALVVGVPLTAEVANKLNYIIQVSTRPWVLSMYSIRLAERVTPIIPQGANLLIWGWNPSVYVDLHAKPATRYAHHARLVMESPVRESLRNSFMKDLEKSAPEWILITDDGFWFPKGTAKPFPALQRYLETYYTTNCSNGEITVLQHRGPVFGR